MAEPRTRPNLRERILDAAVDLLRRHGHRRLSQPQVARAAGIPQGHLTYYFPRRADLLVAVARRSIERVGREIAALPLQVARAHIADLVGFIVKDRPRTRMLLALLVEAGDDSALRKMMVEGAARVRGMLAAMMGIAPEHPDATIALATLWGLGLQHLLLQGEGDDDAQTETLLRRLAAWLEAAPRDAGS
jgi:AcrR family transcriptional regulator